MAKHKGFPVMALILTFMCIVFWYYTITYFNDVYPTIQMFMSAQSGSGDPMLLATLDFNAFFFDILILVICLAGAVITTILTIVGWIRLW